jgi:hypothetical protein
VQALREKQAAAYAIRSGDSEKTGDVDDRRVTRMQGFELMAASGSDSRERERERERESTKRRDATAISTGETLITKTHDLDQRWRSLCLQKSPAIARRA